MAKSITKKVSLPAGPDRVFNALVTPGEITSFFPYTEAMIEPRVGGRLEFGGTANGAGFTDHGRVTRWLPGREFAYTYWSDNHGTENTPANQLSISYSLTMGMDGGTILEMTHSNISSDEYRLMMEAVWDDLLNALANYLSGN